MTFTATASTIRDRAIALVSALVSPTLVAPSFVAYRNEGPADFIAWAIANPAGALRRFQVRDEGIDQPPPVSNTDIERRECTLVIVIAYPQDARAGNKNGLSRDDLIDSDFRQIDYAIGMTGRANFAGSTYDATWFSGGTKSIVRGRVVDLLMIRQSYMYNRVAG